MKNKSKNILINIKLINRDFKNIKFFQNKYTRNIKAKI